MLKMARIVAGIALLFILAGTANSVPPPPSPGIPIGQTGWDYQENYSGGHRVARLPGSDTVHFTWMHLENIWGQFPEYDRTVKFLSIKFGGISIPENFGITLGDYPIRPGYPDLAVGSNNNAILGLHKADVENEELYQPALIDFVNPPTYLYFDNFLTRPLGTCREALWPSIAVRRYPSGEDITHAVAVDNLNDCDPALLWYWRRVGIDIQGPVVIDTIGQLGYCIATAPLVGRTAIVYPSLVSNGLSELNNLFYYESSSEGAGWISGTELGDAHQMAITNYINPNGPQAWLDITAEYDNNGVLHVVWVEQDTAGISRQCALKHWDNQTGVIREVTHADWPLPRSTGVFNLSISDLSLGIGDGSTTCLGPNETNSNYLYVLYTQFAGLTPEEQADHTPADQWHGIYNGELYLVASRDGGASWAEPVNLSNTKTPDCNPGPAEGPGALPLRPDSVCRSEAWGSIGLTVSDIDIVFISDIDAGGIVQGDGTWQLNPVHYLRIPGGTTDAPLVCPDFAPRLNIQVDGINPICGLLSEDGIKPDTAIYYMYNYGSDELRCSLAISYDIPPIAPTQWMTINDSTESLVFTVPAGGPPYELRMVVDPTGLDAGIYNATVPLYHNSVQLINPYPLSQSIWVRPCDCHADPICDGVTNIQDVVGVINTAFRGQSPGSNENCPVLDLDVNCSDDIDVLDVVHMVNVAFRGQNPDSEFCWPCDDPLNTR